MNDRIFNPTNGILLIILLVVVMIGRDALSTSTDTATVEVKTKNTGTDFQRYTNSGSTQVVDLYMIKEENGEMYPKPDYGIFSLNENNDMVEFNSADIVKFSFQLKGQVFNAKIECDGKSYQGLSAFVGENLRITVYIQKLDKHGNNVFQIIFEGNGKKYAVTQVIIPEISEKEEFRII